MLQELLGKMRSMDTMQVIKTTKGKQDIYMKGHQWPNFAVGSLKITCTMYL